MKGFIDVVLYVLAMLGTGGTVYWATYWATILGDRRSRRKLEEAKHQLAMATDRARRAEEMAMQWRLQTRLDPLEWHSDYPAEIKSGQHYTRGNPRLIGPGANEDGERIPNWDEYSKNQDEWNEYVLTNYHRHAVNENYRGQWINSVPRPYEMRDEWTCPHGKFWDDCPACGKEKPNEGSESENQ